LDLPAEIRNEIYRYAIIPESGCLVPQVIEMPATASCNTANVRLGAPSISQQSNKLALLCTCKQLHHEAGAIYFEETRLRVSLYSYSEIVLEEIRAFNDFDPKGGRYKEQCLLLLTMDSVARFRTIQVEIFFEPEFPNSIHVIDIMAALYSLATALAKKQRKARTTTLSP